MKDGIEFAIKLLEKYAARHNYLGSGDFTKGNVIVQQNHFISAEACLCVVRNLKVKLRSLKSKVSATTASNSQSDAILALRDLVEMIEMFTRFSGSDTLTPIGAGKLNRAKDVLKHAHI